MSRLKPENLLVSAAAMKDLARDRVTEKFVILPPELTITDARPPFPTGRDDHPLHMVPRGVQPALRSEGEVYPQGVVEKKGTDRVPLEIKGDMVWGEIQFVGGVGTPRHLITVDDLWRVGEETHPLLDRTWNAEEVHPEGGEAEVGIIFPFVNTLE